MGKKKVYIVLTDTGTMFTRLIKLYTKKPYNHASISFDEELTEVYSFGRKLPRNPFIGGFVRENVKCGLFKNANCKIYSCEITEEQYFKMRNFIQDIEKKQHHYRYNLLGLIGFAFNKPINREHAYFCSEFVATVLQEGEVLESQRSPSLVAPHDLQNVSFFKLTYQGRLTDFPFTQKEKVFSPAARLTAIGW